MFILSCTNYSSASISRGSKIDTFAICGVYQKKPNINAFFQGVQSGPIMFILSWTNN